MSDGDSPRRRVVYEPAGRAQEYSHLACNLYAGCDHDCTYCYAPDVLHVTRAAFAVPRVRPGVLDKLRLDCRDAAERGEQRQVMLCFTCDPYMQLDVTEQLTRRAIEILHEYGQSVCVLTKGGIRALRDLDLFRPGDAFAVSLTCSNDRYSRFWEPNASLPQERIDTLRAFREAYNGAVETWASLEPVLFPPQSLEMIERAAPWVHEVRLGKLNHLVLAQRMDWYDYGTRAVALCERLGVRYKVKVDLRELMGVPE